MFVLECVLCVDGVEVILKSASKQRLISTKNFMHKWLLASNKRLTVLYLLLFGSLEKGELLHGLGKNI